MAYLAALPSARQSACNRRKGTSARGCQPTRDRRSASPAVERVSKRESKQLHCVKASDLHAFLLGSKAEELINERQRLFKPLYIPTVSSPDQPVRAEGVIGAACELAGVTIPGGFVAKALDSQIDARQFRQPDH